MTRLRFKYFMPERNEFSTTGEETLLSVSEYYGVKPRSAAFEANAAESRASSLEGYRKVQAGDFVMNYMLAWKGAYGVSDHDGIVSPAYAVFKINPRYAEPRYIHHRLRSEHMRSEFRKRSKGIIESRLRLYPDSFLSMEIALPDISTQKSIADFLDRETTRIDQLVEKKTVFTKLLNQRRAAIISHVVTKGLDAAEPVKDSGVDWIGSIPVSWSMMKLGYLGSCANGINIGGAAFGSGFPFVSYGDAYNNRELPFEVTGLVQSSNDERNRYSVRRGDVLFTRTSETIEEIGFSSVCLKTIEDAVFAGFLIRFRPKAGALEPRFSKFAFQNLLLRDFFSKEMMLVTRASLSQGLLKKMPIPVPPIGTQGKIANFLEGMDSKITSTIAKNQHSIALLSDLRTALTTAAVTGQIDVAKWNKEGQTDRRLEEIEEEVTKREGAI